MNPKNYSNKFKNGIQSILQIEILILIITIITSVYSYIIIFTDKLILEYAYNELFINYQAGLIRRGLLGEIFWQLDKYFELNPKMVAPFFLGWANAISLADITGFLLNDAIATEALSIILLITISTASLFIFALSDAISAIFQAS